MFSGDGDMLWTQLSGMRAETECESRCIGGKKDCLALMALPDNMPVPESPSPAQREQAG